MERASLAAIARLADLCLCADRSRSAAPIAPLWLSLSLCLGVEVGTLCTCLRSRSIVRAARWQPGRRFFRGASWSWSADDGVMHGRGGPPRLTRPSEERSMNIIRVIFVMALELTVIYTRETDRVPMTASDLSRPSLLPVDRALEPPSPPPAPPDSAPEAKENQNPQKQKVVACSSSSLLRDLPGFAIRGNRPGGEGLCPPARLHPSGIFNLTLVCLRSPFDVLSGDFAIKSCFSVRLHPTGVRA